MSMYEDYSSIIRSELILNSKFLAENESDLLNYKHLAKLSDLTNCIQGHSVSIHEMIK